LHSAKTPEEQASTKSLALFYLSVWKSADSAQAFAKLYGDSLGRKYSNLKPVADDGGGPSAVEGSEEQVFSTTEGPVVITTRGKMVFVAESFPLPVARKLTSLILDAQGSGVVRMAEVDGLNGDKGEGGLHAEPAGPLTGDLVRFLQGCGVMKAAVDGAIGGSLKPKKCARCG